MSPHRANGEIRHYGRVHRAFDDADVELGEFVSHGISPQVCKCASVHICARELDTMIMRAPTQRERTMGAILRIAVWARESILGDGREFTLQELQTRCKFTSVRAARR